MKKERIMLNKVLISIIILPIKNHVVVERNEIVNLMERYIELQLMEKQ